MSTPGQSATVATSRSPFCTPAGTVSVSDSPLGAEFVLPPRYATVAREGVAVGATVGVAVGTGVGVGVGVGATDTANVAAGSLTE